MGVHRLVLFLGATALVTGCGLSSTPTRALSGAAGDAVATAQRDALGLGDMAIQDSTALPNLTLQSGRTLSLLGTSSLSVGGATTLGPLSAGATTLSSTLGVVGNSTLRGNFTIDPAIPPATSSPTFTVAASSGDTVIKGTLQVDGAITSNSAINATHLKGGVSGSLPYQNNQDSTTIS